MWPQHHESGYNWRKWWELYLFYNPIVMTLIQSSGPVEWILVLFPHQRKMIDDVNCLIVHKKTKTKFNKQRNYKVYESQKHDSQYMCTICALNHIRWNLSYSLHCGDSQRWTCLAAIEEIVASCEPWPWSTNRFAVAVLYAPLITIPLMAIYLENSGAYSDSRRRNECGRPPVFSAHSRQIKDSLLCNTPREEVGRTSARHYSRRK